MVNSRQNTIALVAAMAALTIAFIANLSGQYANARTAQTNCKAIERLNERVRMRAINDYKQLNETAKLLNIDVTPALIKRAKQDLHRTLHDYAPKECPFPIFWGR